jgi:phosphoribosylformylglycinamidine synthase
MELPSAHGEGRFWADGATLAALEAQGLVALRYVDEAGRATQAFPDNPNGSAHAIAGVSDPSGRVLGLMPHPERYVSPHQHPDAHRRDPGRVPDGLCFFQALVNLA